MDMLFTPLLSICGLELTTLTIVLSCAMAWMVTLPFFVVAGKQDKERHEIDGIPLVVISVTTIIHALLFIGIFITLIVAVVSYFAYREKEIPIMGQADFVLLSHWATAPFCFGSGSGLMIISSLLFLGCIMVYIHTYRDENGKKWKHGKMVPLFPPYVTTVITMAVVSIPFELFLSEVGL